MLRINDYQLARLALVTREAVHRDLSARLGHEHPELAEEAEDIVAGAMADAAEVEIHEVEAIYRMAQLPGYPNVPGKWGALIPRALANRLAADEARLTFIERELVPRIHRELEDTTNG